MKRNLFFLAVACSALLAMVIVGSSRVNTSISSSINASHTFIQTVWADGGYPTPPIPPGSGLKVSRTNWADGGYPTPPIPPGPGPKVSATNWADGGYPTPPIPPGSDPKSVVTLQSILS